MYLTFDFGKNKTIRYKNMCFYEHIVNSNSTTALKEKYTACSMYSLTVLLAFHKQNVQ